MSANTTARAVLATALAGLSLGTAAVASADDAADPSVTASVQLHAGDQLVDAYDCAWSGAPDTDRCRLIVQDGPDQVDFMTATGVDQAQWTTRIPGQEVDNESSLTRRADGTWLFRGTSYFRGGPVPRHDPSTYGFVSDANGRDWVRYEVSARATTSSVVRAQSARKAIARASVRLRAKSR